MCTCSTFDSLLPVVTIPACFLTLIIYLQFIDVVGSLASRIKLLGITVDSHLYMFKQTKLVSQYCFYRISYTAVAIALTLVSSRLDYANSVLYGSPAKNISAEGLECGSNSCNTKATTLCLQSIHSVNSTGCQFSGSSNYLQNHAHWPYLSRLLIPYHPSLVLRSFSSSHLLQVPHIIEFSVLAVSMQLPQLFGTLYRTQSIHQTHLTLSAGTLKHLFLAAFSTH